METESRVQLLETDIDGLEVQVAGVRKEMRRMVTALWAFSLSVAGSALTITLTLAATH